MVNPEAVDRNAANAPPASSADSSSPSRPGLIGRRQHQHHGVGAHADGQLRQVDPAEDAVQGSEQVEGAEQPDDDEGGAPGGAPVGVGVEADHHVRQPHRAEAEREQGAVGRVDRVVTPAEPAEGVGPLVPGGRPRHVRRRLSRPGPQPEQDERGHADGGELEPVLHRLDERDRAHAARDDVGEDHHRDDEPAEPGRCTGHRLQRQPGALELRQQVEPADPEDEHGARAGGPRRSRAGPRRSPAACRRPSGATARRRGRAARGSPRCSRRGTTACRRRGSRRARRCRGTRRQRGTRRRSPTRSSAARRCGWRRRSRWWCATGAGRTRRSRVSPGRPG